MAQTLLVLALLVTAAGDAAVRGHQNATASATDFLLQSGAIPTYPPIPWTARFTGTVDILVTVQRGEVVKADATSSAHETLVNAAVANVKTWKFSNDKSGTFTSRYVYELEPETTELQNPRVEMQVPRLVKITAKPVVTCFDCGTSFRAQPFR